MLHNIPLATPHSGGQQRRLNATHSPTGAELQFESTKLQFHLLDARGNPGGQRQTDPDMGGAHLCAHYSAQSHVGNLHVSAFCQQNIRWLDVAVKDPLVM